MLGPLRATDIHTPGLTLKLQKTLSLFRHVLRQSRSPALPTSPTSCLSHNYELDVNGLIYDDAKKLDQRSPERADALDAEMPVRLTIRLRTPGLGLDASGRRSASGTVDVR